MWGGVEVVEGLVSVELIMGEQGGNRSRGLLGEATGFKVGGHVLRMPMAYSVIHISICIHILNERWIVGLNV